MAVVKLPDGSRREIPDGSTVFQLAESIGKGLAKAAIVGKVNGKLVDLSHKLSGEHEVSIVTDRESRRKCTPSSHFLGGRDTAPICISSVRRSRVDQRSTILPPSKRKV